jgi:hypothetical protein
MRHRIACIALLLVTTTAANAVRAQHAHAHGVAQPPRLQRIDGQWLGPAGARGLQLSAEQAAIAVTP